MNDKSTDTSQRWSRTRTLPPRTRSKFGTEDDRDEYLKDLRHQIIGFTSAILLTGLPFALVMIGGFSATLVFTVIAVCAVVQTVVHFHYFLHIDLQKSHRDDLQLILFTGLIIFLMVAGTLWILTDLHMRMMQ